MKKKDENKLQQECWLYVEKNHKELIMHAVVNGFGINIPETIPKQFHDTIRKIIAIKVQMLTFIGMKSGISDTLIHGKNGRCLWCEFKTPTGTQREAQIRMQNKVLSNGGRYIMPRTKEQFTKDLTENMMWLLDK